MDAISGVLVQVEIPLDYYYLGDQKAPGSETKLSSSQRLLLILSTKCIFDKRAWEMKKGRPLLSSILPLHTTYTYTVFENSYFCWYEATLILKPLPMLFCSLKILINSCRFFLCCKIGELRRIFKGQKSIWQGFFLGN